MTRLLLVEDDPEIAHLLEVNLSQLAQEASLEICTNGAAGLEAALQGEFDIILLDVMLPGLHGTEICKRVREKDSKTPIMLLTARSTELDKVLGLELGADDYVCKPFAVEELFARIKALLRRSGFQKTPATATGSAELNYSELSIDCDARVVEVSGERLELTPIEYDLLLFLARHPGKAFSREELLKAVWGATEAGNESIVNSHVNRLRKKLSASDEQRFIKTLWGLGYRFSKSDELN